MLIRSQDKKILVNLDNTKNIYTGDSTVTAFYTGEEYDTIGFYSTEAKAIKVLDMIQEEYQRTEQYRGMENNYRELCHVFQMPSDEEVEG